ncbi:CehA/McbA family metallohydrolase [Streptomyces sp. NPDC046985]|uniref:CehA/McbA family metallohydrolase n=1 Tax=Streptomyces sp. NPDC046985 TaxID=3155377 RepID=UPI0033ECEDFE
MTIASGSGSGSGDGAAGGVRRTRVLRGMLPPGSPDYVYLPVEVPPGTREIAVSYAYDRPSAPPGARGNALDVGLFDERGTAFGGRGFRGWSGGARTEFFVRADEATPGYLPGPVGAGLWHIALAPYTVAPRGLAYEVAVTLTRGEPGRAPRPVYPPDRAKGRGRAWYRGDCHLHSVHSDGRRAPAEIAAGARAAGLDFINSSDHNTTSSHAHWAEHAGDDLLIMLGEEVTTRNGHVLVVGAAPGAFADWRYRARDGRFAAVAREIRSAGGLVVPAHPYADCLGCAWKFGYAQADAAEVWNGPFTPDDETALAAWDALLTTSAHDHGDREHAGRGDGDRGDVGQRDGDRGDGGHGDGGRQDDDRGHGAHDDRGHRAHGDAARADAGQGDGDLGDAGQGDGGRQDEGRRHGALGDPALGDPALGDPALGDPALGGAGHGGAARTSPAPHWLPAMGNSDAHRPPDAVGAPQTVVLADDLTREAILAGLRAGRSYIAESARVSLAFTATATAADGAPLSAGIGERLAAPEDAPVTVRLTASGAPRCTARLVTDQGAVLTAGPFPVSGTGEVEWRTTPAHAAYVRAELRHETAAGPVPGVAAALTNPIFLGDGRPAARPERGP